MRILELVTLILREFDHRHCPMINTYGNFDDNLVTYISSYPTDIQVIVLSYSHTTLEWFTITHLYPMNKVVIDKTAKHLIQRYFQGDIRIQVTPPSSGNDKLFLNLVLENVLNGLDNEKIGQLCSDDMKQGMYRIAINLQRLVVLISNDIVIRLICRFLLIFISLFISIYISIKFYHLIDWFQSSFLNIINNDILKLVLSISLAILQIFKYRQIANFQRRIIDFIESIWDRFVNILSRMINGTQHSLVRSTSILRLYQIRMIKQFWNRKLQRL